MIVNEVCIHYYNETLPRKRANARDAAVPSRKKTKQGNADPPENIGGGGWAAGLRAARRNFSVEMTGL